MTLSGIQHRTATRGARHEVPGRNLLAFARPYSGLPDLTYPLHDRDLLVTTCGRICMHRKRVNISTVLAGQRLGIKEVDDGIWIVSFMHYDLGFIDLEQKTLQPLDNPFGTGCHPCLRYVLLPMSPVQTMKLVELRGVEPPTSAVRLQRSPN